MHAHAQRKGRQRGRRRDGKEARDDLQRRPVQAANKTRGCEAEPWKRKEARRVRFSGGGDSEVSYEKRNRERGGKREGERDGNFAMAPM